MTIAQRNKLMIELWPAACRAQGWKVSDRNFRLVVLSIAVCYFEITTQAKFFEVLRQPVESIPRRLTSAGEITEGEEFTRVKGLLMLLADNVAGAKEAGDSSYNRERQKRHIVIELMRCLALYPVAKPMGIDGAEAYVAEVITGKFKRLMGIEELSTKPIQFVDRKTGRKRNIPSQLDQLLYTVTNRVNGYRTEAGHSEHEMKRLAGVKCRDNCKTCYP